MIIGSISENKSLEKRISITPEISKKYITNGEYPNAKGDFLAVETKLIQKGYEPSIYDFSIEVNGNNLTDEILSEEKLLIYISFKVNSLIHT